MRLNKVLLFASAVACAVLLMASRDTKNAIACGLTLSATCHTSNPSYINVGGCYYDNCSNGGGTVKIYNNCSSTCTGCTYLTSVTSGGGGLFCTGYMQGTYNVNCASPDQKYVCAFDVASNTWAPAVDVGYCDCIQSPTAAAP